MAKKPIKRRRRSPKPSLLQRLRGDFLTGLVVVLPMFLTVYLLWTAIGFIDDRVVPLIPNRYNPENMLGRNIFGLGLVVFLVFTTMVGALTKGIIGREILQFGERVLDRMPIVRSVYNGLKQIAETIFSQSNTSFQRACLVEYPRKGLWAVAFVATETAGEVRARAGEDDLISVFLPTTPNPTSGFLLFVPRRDVRVLDMSVEEAAKLIISAGLVEPPDRRAQPVPPASAAPVATAQRPKGAGVGT